MEGVSASPWDGALTLRPERDDEADRTFLFALFAATKAAEMAAMPVDAAAKDFLLRAQYRSMTATYRQDYPRARWEVVELIGEPVGRLVTDVGDRCVTYVDIAFLPRAQGRGLATRLMMGARRAASARPARAGECAHEERRVPETLRAHWLRALGESRRCARGVRHRRAGPRALGETRTVYTFSPYCIHTSEVGEPADRAQLLR